MATRLDTLNEKWATGLSLDTFTVGEIYNEDVINTSIEIILSTLLGKRLFNLQVGSDFQLRLFDNMNGRFSEQLLTDTVAAIKLWDNRLVILEDYVRLIIDPDGNKAMIEIPYVVPSIGLKATFKRKIVR